MAPLCRRERWLVGLWAALGLLAWNGVYDLILGRGIKEYLFRSALHEAGRGPQVAVATVLDPFIFEATWTATFWAAVVLLAGLVTIRTLRGSGRVPSANAPRLPNG